MQIKTTISLHTCQNGYYQNDKCWRRCKEKGIFSHCWWECKFMQLLWRTVWRFLKNLKIEPAHDSTLLLLSICLKNMKTLSQRYLAPHVHCRMIYMAKIQKQPKCPSVVEWIKMWYSLVCSEVLLSCIKEGDFAICNNTMDLEGIMLSAKCQTEKDKYHTISLLCGIL